MNYVLEQIIDRINNAQRNRTGFVDAVFGIKKQEALNGTPVVLFGAGSLGEDLYSHLTSYGIFPVCFCDNDASKSGGSHCGIPIISFAELKKSHKNSLIVIATLKYLGSISDQLIGNGFYAERIMFSKYSKETNWLVAYYSIHGPVSKRIEHRHQCDTQTELDILMQNEDKVLEAYKSFADQKSKELFITLLALRASNAHFDLFKDFMLNFSEPIHEFGLFKYEGTPEDYYYFNNDVLSMSNNEIYVDVGAFDGDTVHTFIQACENQKLKYKHIYAFEPDPKCYNELVRNTSVYDNISHHQAGLWSESKVLRFKSFDESLQGTQGGAIDNTGDIEIQVVSLDDFLKGREVSFIKMDPPGNIMLEAMKGASGTIAKYKPKLAFAAYHSVASTFEVPLLVKSICPDYQLYLRHNTYFLCDTDLFAVAG
ncbi:MAG: FkbM family methyltransferase [Syntrophobacteraceae bacterium]|jgi:FkbM family methyltransferase